MSTLERKIRSRDCKLVPRVGGVWPWKSKKMANWKRSTLDLLFFVCLASISPTVAIDSSHCMSMGYTSNLMCSSCRELKEFGLQDLESECSGCCQPDGAANDEKVCYKFQRSFVIFDSIKKL